LPSKWDCHGNVTLVSWGVRIVFSTAVYKAPCRPKLKEFSTPYSSRTWFKKKKKKNMYMYSIAWSEIFIEPPPYAQQRRRRGERGTGVTKGS
jgi:hypothetical protein